MSSNNTFSGLFDENENDDSMSSISSVVSKDEIDELLDFIDDPSSSVDDLDDDKEYLVSLTENGLHIESQEIVKKMEYLSLSASTIASMEKCPAKWAFEKYVKPEILPEDDDTPGRRGSLFHDVMEEFFKKEKEERTKNELFIILKKIVKEKYPMFAKNKEVIDWLMTAISNYYEMGGKPQKVEIAYVPKHKKYEDDPDAKILGLEAFVKGPIGNTRRKTLGFIDQVIKDPINENGIIVSDWKSAAKLKEWKKNTRSKKPLRERDGFDEQRQQLLYSMLLEQKGEQVNSARLVYPVAKGVINVDVHDEELRKEVVETVEEADEKLHDSIENNTFEYGPSFLCSWCPLFNICPAKEVKTFQKALDAQEKQPTAEELMVGVRV